MYHWTCARYVLTTVVLAMLAMPTVAWSLPPEDVPAPAHAPHVALARQQQANSALRVRLALASSDTFTLLLEPDGSALHLTLRGVELATFPVEILEVGRPRVIFSTAPPVEWRDVVWEHGLLSPERPATRDVRVAPGTSASDSTTDEAPPLVPPTAEETIVVPSRYFVRFDGGLALEVVSPARTASSGRWSRTVATAKAWVANLRSASSADRDRVRLRLWLDPADAATLYRALPPEVGLLATSAQ
ncbi:MAG: hypothetical protein O3A25_18700 [Acidobacteria bacterium]|nr:hypothetical protein [Acidobacteriota bacterium]